MPITADLTIREAAALAGVPRTTVEKALEAGILRSVTGPARFRGGATRYLPIRAVAYFHSLKAADLTDLALRHKREIWARLAGLEPWRLEAIEFTPGAMLDLPRLVADPLRDAERYRDARDRYIVSDGDILGGTPVIVGTRLTVYSVLGRLRDGDGIDDLTHDYPEIPREAFEAAGLYAKAHPLRGRPSRRAGRLRRGQCGADSGAPPQGRGGASSASGGRRDTDFDQGMTMAIWRPSPDSGWRVVKTDNGIGACGARIVKASEFKATCLKPMDEVANSGEEIVITKNGRPVSRLADRRRAGRRPQALVAALRHRHPADKARPSQQAVCGRP